MKSADNKRKTGIYDSERDQQIERNMPLVGYVTARFLGRGYEYEDLYQYGCIGLIKAVDRFDPQYGVAFSTYAVPLIIGEIKRFLRGDGTVHISRTIKENAVKLLHAMESDEKEGLSNTFGELCEKTGIEKQAALLAMSALSPVRSLHESISGDGELLLEDTLGSEEGQRLNDRIALKQAMETLNDFEKELIDRRYYSGETQSAIASEMGLSQVQISRMEKKVLARLRELLIR